MYADKVFLYAAGVEVGSADVLSVSHNYQPNVMGLKASSLELICANFIESKLEVEELVGKDGVKRMRLVRKVTAPEVPLADVPLPDLQCESMGHLYDKAEVVYRDGVCITRCVRCEERAEIKPELGMKLLAMKLNAEAMDALTPTGDGDLVALQRSIAEVEEEIADLRQAVSQAKHTESMLRRRLTRDAG